MEEPITQTSVQDEGVSQQQGDGIATDGKQEELFKGFDPFEVVNKEEVKKKEIEEDVEIESEDQKIIGKVVKNETRDIKANLESVQSELKLAQFLSSQEGELYRPYSEQIKKVMSHPSTKGMKMEAVVALALGSQALMKIGAEQYAKAMEQSKASNTGGNATVPMPQGGLKPADQLSGDEWKRVISKFNV